MRSSIAALLILLLSLLTLSCRTAHLAQVQPQLYGIGADSVQAAIPAVETMIAPYKKKLDAVMDEPVGEVAAELPMGAPESPLGNWLSDVVQLKARELFGERVDFSLLNAGGVRTGALPKGTITERHLFELMPFDNTLVLLHLDAARLRQLVDHLAARGGWPVSKELNFRIVDGKARDVTVGGQPIRDDRTYLVAMPDYVANGGDDTSFLPGAKREEQGILIRDIFIEQVKALTAAGQKIFAEKDGRVQRGD